MIAGKRIAVVVPAFNEADKIAGTVHSIPAFVDHVIVVDDGSADDTAARAVATFAGPGREVIRHPQNRGVGAAIATGYARALELGMDAVAVMAGDAQMDPADLEPLLAPVLAERAEYAKGNRFAWPGGSAAMPRVRRWGNRALSWLTRRATGYAVSDSQCGYTVASRRALEVIGPGNLFARYGYPNDLLGRLAAARARVVDVPVRPVYGPAWRSGLRPSRVAAPIARLLVRITWQRASRAVRRLLGEAQHALGEALIAGAAEHAATAPSAGDVEESACS
jgi:glycosyltransferase involved in cell wall biosynthesis